MKYLYFFLSGSPNSQLSIPRYPAFDFGEQEDAQSLFPSPSVCSNNYLHLFTTLFCLSHSNLT